MEREIQREAKDRRNRRNTERTRKAKEMTHKRTQGSKLCCVTILCLVVLCHGVALNDLLDRASQRSDKLHSLSTSLSHELDSNFPLIGRMMMPRPSMCHTSSLQTPNDKEQALRVSESNLLSLARSLLQAWIEPLSVLSSTAPSLPHHSRNSIFSKVQELQEHSRRLGDGLDILSNNTVTSLPYRGGNDLGQDKTSRLVNFHFLLSCFRRDSHKIDSFLKVLRCRATKIQPEMC